MSGRFSTYEVLLRRGNGLNKTVYIHDCMSDQEAKETAEAMYGMEVLRVLWRGRTDDFEEQSNSNSVTSSTGNSTSEMSFDQILAVGALILIAAIAMFVWEMALAVWAFVLAYWPWILSVTIVIFLCWIFMLDDEEED